MNLLVGERLAIITPKPQTTRQRMLGIVNTDTSQIVFSDTPGKIDDPRYEMQKVMNRSIRTAFEDADLVLLMTTVEEKPESIDSLIQQSGKSDAPVFLIVNKSDLVEEDKLDPIVTAFSERGKFARVFVISALNNRNVDELYAAIEGSMPIHPPFYPKDQLTDKPERFFVSEIVREKILEQYHQEIPYSCEVIVESFKHEESSKGPIIKIAATIYVNRKTQKAIIIGKQGKAIKKLGMEARKDIETFLESHVFLELYVRVKENWRDDERLLRSFGYN